MLDLIVGLLFMVGFGSAVEMVRLTCRRWLSTPRRAPRLSSPDHVRHHSFTVAE